jgi:hypothetical protein
MKTRESALFTPDVEILISSWGSVEKKPPAAFSPFSRAHVLCVRSARKNGCGLAGQTFLNQPGTLMSNLIRGKFALENLLFNIPMGKEFHPTGFNILV